MKFSELPAETVERLKERRYDQIVEKHEGPWDWEWQIEHDECESIQVGGYFILLPVYLKHHPNITILRVVESKDENVLTIFLKDTTYDNDDFFSGFVAICERFAGEEFFTAIVYHEWFIIENSE